MAQFTIEMRCDNAAFDEPGPEIARILIDVAAKVAALAEAGEFGEAGIIRDINGNTVGRWAWTVD